MYYRLHIIAIYSKILYSYYFIYFFIGSVAAAVTGISFIAVSFMEEFIASHPFIVLITDHRTDAVLFMGRVCSPQGSSKSEHDKSFTGSGQSDYKL